MLAHLQIPQVNFIFLCLKYNIENGVYWVALGSYILYFLPYILIFYTVGECENEHGNSGDGKNSSDDSGEKCKYFINSLLVQLKYLILANFPMHLISCNYAIIQTLKVTPIDKFLKYIVKKIVEL